MPVKGLVEGMNRSGWVGWRGSRRVYILPSTIDRCRETT